jgi:hypothetical protein
MPKLETKAQYRWFIYSKIGTCVLAINGLRSLDKACAGKPHSRELRLALAHIIEELEVFIAVLTEHTKAIKSWPNF